MRKILAVDDNRINLELLAQIVRMYYPDYHFFTALSGEEGIEVALKELPDLILLDIMMPGMDGYETCQFLKDNDFTKQIPIIMVSALGHDSSERTKGLNAGADSFISKPFDQVELKAQINVALRIKQYQERLRKLNTEITLVEERERRRIAENLHDSLGQTLSLAFMHLSSVNKGECPEHIQHTLDFTSKLLDKAIKESRSLTYDLSPPILYELGLIPAVKWKLEQFENEYELKTSLVTNNKEEDLSREYKIFFYRTIGELLMNIFKHAKATHVEVRLFMKEHSFVIEVQDNGEGIDKSKIKAASAKGGFGLMSIVERIDSINGTFSINPNEEGTIAKIKVPLNGEE